MPPPNDSLSNPLIKSTPVSVRMSEALRGAIRQSAAANGLSVNREIERALERVYRSEGDLGDPRTLAILWMIADLIRRTEERSRSSWLEDARTWEAVRRLVVLTLDAHEPRVEPEEGLSTAQDELERALREEAFAPSLGNAVRVLLDDARERTQRVRSGGELAAAVAAIIGLDLRGAAS